MVELDDPDGYILRVRECLLVIVSPGFACCLSGRISLDSAISPRIYILMQAPAYRCLHLQVDASLGYSSKSLTIRSSRPSSTTRSYRSSHSRLSGCHRPPAVFTVWRSSFSCQSTRRATIVSAPSSEVVAPSQLRQRPAPRS